MPQPHVIQLNGPWEVAALDDNGDEVRQERINIRAPNYWEQVGDLMSQPEVNRFQLSRKFNWPATEAARIQLEIRGTSPDQLTLNDQPLEFTGEDGRIHAEVTELQSAGNQLLICYDRANLGAGRPLISGVCLKINDSAAVKD